MQTTQSSSVLVLATSYSGATDSDSNSETAKTSLLPLRKACDSCRRRKTRCDRKIPCGACKVSCLKCEYLAVHQKRGPKLRRIRNANPPKTSNCESSITSDDSPSPSTPGTTAPDVCPNQGLGITRPYSAVEVPKDVSSESPIESSSDSYHVYAQSDSPGAYHSFIGNVIDDFVAQDTVGEGNSSPEDLVGNAFTYEPPLDSSTPAEGNATNITFSVFAPYIKLFLEYLYPIMPVFDRNTLIADLTFRVDDAGPLSLEEIAVFSALSAAVIVQLNVMTENEISASKGTPSDSNGAYETTEKVKVGTRATAESFISQSLSARQRSDFIDSPSVNWILTSFFLFDYYGNLQRHTTAWYYLREAIGLALELKLDVEELYSGAEHRESQRRKRLFWLLFVTER
ncbi:hypothetical protein TWF281_010866 [Arthrobotrys megalospora]